MPPRSSAIASVALLAAMTQVIIANGVADGDQANQGGSTERYHRQLTHSARETFDVIHRYCRERGDAPDHR
ncbi:MAG TPA: hypothetical protein VM165_05640, partial [Planctomycetaceae bacterium]|nr:hypothetical protein [Planctomycetaceae bacterium]